MDLFNKMLKEKKNFILGLIFIAIGFLFGHESMSYVDKSFGFTEISSGMFPLGLSLILLINGILLTITSIKWR